MNNEFDDMKNLWQNAPAAQIALNAQQIEALLAKRSKNALQSLRTNLLWEFALGIILTVLLLYAAIQAESTAERFAILQVMFVIGPCFIFYFFALKNLKKGISMHRPLRSMLEESIQFWQMALRIYFWGGVLLLPIVFFAARLWRQQTIGTGSLQFFTGSTPVILFKAFLAWALVSGLVLGFNQVFLRKICGQTENLLKEMDAVV